jgi:sacsin
MTAEGGVLNFGVARQTVTQLLHNLHLPHTLPEGEDEEIYRDLLPHFLNLTSGNTPEVQVPNASRAMVNCHDLFERTDFFLAAFGEASDRFLLQSFDSFTPNLSSKGLKRMEDLDLNLFSLCARLFEGQCNGALQDGGRLEHEWLERAKLVYTTYCEALPIYVHSDEAESWYTLDDIRFIPRNTGEGRKYASQDVELPECIRSLPHLVSPNQVVRSQFYGISWTQRAALEQEPGQRLRVAFPDFGKPSLAEVVSHELLCAFA